MKRVSIFHCFSILLIILLVNRSLAASVEKDEALTTDASKENTLDEFQNSKAGGWQGGHGFQWGGHGRAFPWFGPGGHHGPGGPGGWHPWGGWFPWVGRGGNGVHGGGGEGGFHPGGISGTPGGWFPWGGRGGNGGGSGGSPGAPGGPNCGGNGGGPGGGAGGCGGNGGAGGGSGGGRGGGWVPPHTTMPNPGDAPCGNMQIVPSANGYTISYDCGNCKYQYTVDNNGMATGGSGNCS